ncbi:MAG: tetratricopeptide repeat protein, partial [Acidobacteriota bacterium]
ADVQVAVNRIQSVDETHAKTAWEALAEAKRRAPGASPVEMALVDALESRYAMPQPGDRKPLDEAYAKAMARVHRRFPKDADVAALYAEALMDVRPWDQWTHDGKAQPGTRETLDAIAAALALDPAHPLALHLKIHALEASPHPEGAREAADRLSALVPDSSHLVHMPAHIYARIGRWADAASANERAIAADDRYNARAPGLGIYRIYEAHNVHFLAFTAMMEGRRKVAQDQAAALVAMLPPPMVKEMAFLLEAFLTVPQEVRMRFGLWDEILEQPLPGEDLPTARAFAHFARGVALGALGRVDEADKERTAFAEAAARVPGEFLWGSNPTSAVLASLASYLDRELAFRRGDRAAAEAKLREAVAREDALKYDEPPPSSVPARHALGAVLLAAGKAREAEAVYREDLRRSPENGWSLLGLSRALHAQGRKDAAGVHARSRAAWKRADVEVTSSCLCIPGDAAGAR